MTMKTPLPLLLCCFACYASSATSRAQEPSELPRLRASYEAALQRVTKPVNDTYLGELMKLRDSYTKAGKLSEAVALTKEMNIIRTRLGLPTEQIAAMPAAAPQPAAPTVAGGEMEVTIPANSMDGYVLGAVGKGDVITLQYVSGLWKNHGFIPTENPDDPKGKGGENTRLVIALPAEKGLPGKLIKVVPPSTAATPFTFTFPTTRDSVVLRINSNRGGEKSPGKVVYRVQIRRQ
jgi:hypothetical protein